MARRFSSAPLVVGLAALAACVSLAFRAQPNKLQPWTIALSEVADEQPSIAVYRARGQRLVWIAAQHDNRTDSATFQLIDAAFAAFRFDTVIAEGFPTSWGENPVKMLRYVETGGKVVDGAVEGGETIPTIAGARRQGARLVGGEVDDAVVVASLTAKGFHPEDILGFYVLRVIPQWQTEGKISDAGDPRLGPLVTQELARQRMALGMPAGFLPDFVAWAAWYSRSNRKALDASFSVEEVGPRSDGTFDTNRIAYAISLARDTHLHNLTIARLNAGHSVLVVFGGSHLVIQRPALDAALGPPCYAGSSVAAALQACR